MDASKCSLHGPSCCALLAATRFDACGGARARSINTRSVEAVLCNEIAIIIIMSSVLVGGRNTRTARGAPAQAQPHQYHGPNRRAEQSGNDRAETQLDLQPLYHPKGEREHTERQQERPILVARRAM